MIWLDKIKGGSYNTAAPSHRRTVDDEPVKGGLAVTPGHMMQMAERGIPISVGNDNAFYDGEPNPSWDLPLDQLRGADLNDMWNFSRDVRNKVKAGYKKITENNTSVSSDGQTTVS